MPGGRKAESPSASASRALGTGSQMKTAEACQVNVKTVQRLMKERGSIKEAISYPDMAVELA